MKLQSKLLGGWFMRRLALALSAAVLLITFRASSQNSSTLFVTHLRCEYLTNPLGIDVMRPRLSWVLEPGNSTLRAQTQSAYQIVVASSAEGLAADRGDFWDSGKIASDQTIGVMYAGKPLQSKHRYFWKAQVWDEKDRSRDGVRQVPGRWDCSINQNGVLNGSWPLRQ